MSTITAVPSTKASLTVTGLATLASGNYVVSATKDNSTAKPLESMVEVSVTTTNTPAGNKQVKVFAQASFDGGTTWQSGPTSGSTTTDEPDLTFLGVVPINTASVAHTRAFPVGAAYGGVVPPAYRIVLYNDLGVALTAGSVATSDLTGSVA